MGQSTKPASSACNPADIGMKSFFLGPQAENGMWVEQETVRLLQRCFNWRRSLFPQDGSAISQADQAEPEFQRQQAKFARSLDHLVTLLEGEVPKFSPRYVGHMFSELGLPALLGHMAALLHNPNNVSAESSLVGVQLENHAINALFQMLGYSDDAQYGLGHITSGGTVANFEALARAKARLALWLSVAACNKGKRNLFAAAHLGWREFDRLATTVTEEERLGFDLNKGNPFTVAAKLGTVFNEPYFGPVALVPNHRHYSWKKGLELMGFGSEALWPVQLDEHGRMSIDHLRQLIDKAEREHRPILLVVSVAGTTELSQFDPVDEVQEVLDHLADTRGIHIWHHIDAAYGGFFATLRDLDIFQPGSVMQRALKAMSRPNSVTLDPHKLGYVPYACGAFLTRDKRDYMLGVQKAPYIRFEAFDRGPYTIEGSRPATGAAATWMAAESIGFDGEGYGRILARTITICRRLATALQESALPVIVLPDLEANIVSFVVANRGERMSTVNHRTAQLAEALSPAAHGPFYVSKTTLFESAYGLYLSRVTKLWQAEVDCDHLVLIRMCVLNPFVDSVEMNLDLAKDLITAIAQFTDSRLPS